MSLGVPMSTVLWPAVAIALALALAGCNPAGDGDPGFADATTSPAAPSPGYGQPGNDQPGEDVPPANAPPGSVMPDPLPPVAEPGPGMARFDGYAQVDFGMDAEQVKQLWDSELDGVAGEGESCFHLSPVGQPSIAHFALMFVDGRFARYSVANGEMVAPGGGQRGMDREQLEQLYPRRIEQAPHKYVPGGHNLRITDIGGGEGVLVFETDADDRVSEWRVGVPPAIDYVEGCS